MKLENELDVIASKNNPDKGDDDKKGKGKKDNEFKETKETIQIQNKIVSLTNTIKSVNLPDSYIPNKFEHLKKWKNITAVNDEYSSNIEPEIVKQIMLCNVDKIYKILLIMGIGVFANHTNEKYVEIMKHLASEQKLYMVIASSDYIYGTNYQFSHGYLSKDLNTMSQEKTIQAMGRIGRSSIGKTYTIRLRDNILTNKIFQKEENKIEVINMNRLFSSD